MVGEALLSLIRQALGVCEPSEPALSPSQWRELVVLSRKHTVSGMVYQAFTELPSASGVPSDVIDAIVTDSIRIKRRGGRIDAVLKVITSSLKEASPVVMKGPSVAAFYPHPELRTSGDLDLFIDWKHLDTVLSFLREKGYSPVKSPDGAWLCKGEVVDIDLHYSYYDLALPWDNLPPIPSPEAQICMLSMHILKHSMGPGVGLRQLCDLAVVLKKGDYSQKKLRKYFRRNGLDSWNRMLCSFIEDRLGIKTGLYSRKVSYKAFEKMVFEGGDFGRYGKGRTGALSSTANKRKADTARRYLRRLPFALRYAPLRYISYILSLLKGNMRSLHRS